MRMSVPTSPARPTRASFELRSARRDEVPAVQALARVVWWSHYPGIISDAQIEYMLERGYADDALARFVAGPDAGLEVAFAGPLLVGFGAWYASGEAEVKLDKLYVHPEWQRHGVGRGLIARVADLARAGGHRTLVLNVNKHNVLAQAAYRKHGFAVREAVEIDIGNGFVMDDYVMARAL
jgi:ribosomal protein S18 acetylase RimI-like enzyme